MSPEQVRGEEIDGRSDIFSLGVVLYELVTTRLPFRGEFETAINYSILNEDPPSIRTLRKDAPVGLDNIIQSCLEKDKTKRYQNAEEIVVELKKIHRELTGSVDKVTKLSKVWWIAAVIALVVIAVGIYIFYPKSTSISINNKTIAVLPFTNLSDSKEDEYFADGLTEDIITQLSKISGIEKVIARTSIMQYKGVNKRISDIGKELGVATILEGSVRRRGNEVRIVAQLIDVSNEGHLWADTYDKELTQIFAIQSDVAQSIAAALKTKLTPPEKEQIERKQTTNTEAYELYLKGRFYWNKRTATDLKMAIEYFHKAIEKDSLYALAYAGLASTYGILPEYTGLSPKDVHAKAKEAVRRALNLDSKLAEPHAVLGIIKTEYEWDWAGAEIEFKKAIELNPNNPTIHHWYNILLRDLGRLDEALKEIKWAQELDPLSPIINVNLADVLNIMCQYDKAIDHYHKILELNPNYAGAHSPLGVIYTLQGKYVEAIEELNKVRTIVGDSPYGLSRLGYAYARSGQKSNALKVLDDLFNFRKRGYFVSFDIAIVYFGLEKKDKMFEWFELAYQEKDFRISRMKTEPLWDPIRSDPRYSTLLKKIGLEK